MVNQQLRDYVSEQLRLGVAKEAVRGALIESGWAQADVNEVMQSGTGAPAEIKPVAPPAIAMAQKPTIAVQPAVQPVRVIQPAVVAQPVRVSQPAVAFVKPAQSMASQTTDIVQPKTNPFPVSPKANMGTPGTNPVSVSAASGAAAKPVSLGASIAAKTPDRGKLPMIVMIVLALLLGSAAAYFYMQTSDLQVRVSSLSAESETARTQAGALAKERDSLIGRMASLSSESRDLAVNLSFFVAPGGAEGQQAVAFGGTLGSGDKGIYTVKTARGVVVSIKNSRDALVEKALKPLVGTMVQISGTHTAGSREVTVLAVNGASVLPPAPAATSTPAASTTPVASSTPPLP